LLDKILDLIYPPVCGICGKLDENSLCKKCEINLNSQAKFEIDDYTGEKDVFYDEHLYIFPYESIIRKVILKYKFNDSSYLYKTFVNFLIKNSNFVENLKTYDIMIAIPISKERKKSRGYNQSELIARSLSKTINVKMVVNCLGKIQNTVPQSVLNKEERKKNIKNAYKIYEKSQIIDRKVLIVDDIFTTGSTANECSKVLKEAGAKKVGVFTIAKD